MRFLPLLGAALLAAAPAHASTPLYAKAYAIRACTFELAGMSSREAGRKAMDEIWPEYGKAITRDGTERAARFVVIERMLLCGDWK
jgi:hypothetical protein